VAVDRDGYSVVLVLVGEHAGEVGYFDDDEGDQAVVYLGEPFESDYFLIPRTDLEKLTASHIDLERWKRKYPWLAKHLGLP
jgi:hypothetical protein